MKDLKLKQLINPDRYSITTRPAIDTNVMLAFPVFDRFGKPDDRRMGLRGREYVKNGAICRVISNSCNLVKVRFLGQEQDDLVWPGFLCKIPDFLI